MILDLRTWKFDADDYLTSRFWDILITTRKRSLRRLCFYMCLSFCPQGGVSVPVQAGMHTPSLTRGRHPPGTRGRHPLPGPEAGTPAGPEAGSPPPTRGRPIPPRSSACWEICATSGRYASYWNAVLFISIFFFTLFIKKRISTDLCFIPSVFKVKT